MPLPLEIFERPPHNKTLKDLQATPAYVEQIIADLKAVSLAVREDIAAIALPKMKMDFEQKREGASLAKILPAFIEYLKKTDDVEAMFSREQMEECVTEFLEEYYETHDCDYEEESGAIFENLILIFFESQTEHFLVKMDDDQFHFFAGLLAHDMKRIRRQLRGIQKTDARVILSERATAGIVEEEPEPGRDPFTVHVLQNAFADILHELYFGEVYDEPEEEDDNDED